MHIAAAKTGDINRKNCAACHIENARADARIKIIGRNGGGDDGGQSTDVAMIDDLIKFFARPRCGRFGAEIVED